MTFPLSSRSIIHFLFQQQRLLTFIITELAVMEATDKGLVLKEIAPEVTIDDVIKNTDADLIIPHDVKVMKLS